jgi:hypothetical protein
MENQNKSTGISLGTVLFLIFMILKLTGAINWSWWWVTSPLWIPFALIVGVICVGIITGIYKSNKR